MTPRERLFEKVRSVRPTVGRALVIAHRGGSAVAPENTLAALDAAARGGADMAEFDVRVSKDGVPVVIHDHDVSRTTGGTGEVSGLTADEIRALDAGSKFSTSFAGERVPLLTEMLARCRELGLGPLIDVHVRLASAPSFPAKLLKALGASGLLGTAVVVARGPDMADVIAAASPETPVAYLTWNPLQVKSALESRSVAGICPFWRGVDGRLVSAAHSRGKFVLPWTADEPSKQETLLGLGVDGIVTDIPWTLRRIVDTFGSVRHPPVDPEASLWGGTGFGQMARLLREAAEGR